MPTSTHPGPLTVSAQAGSVAGRWNRGHGSDQRALRRIVATTLSVVAGLLGLGSLAAADDADQRHNITLIIANQLGWGDLSCYGARSMATPAIDQVGQIGMKLTACYGFPSSAMTRAALLTGRNPVLVGDWTPEGTGHLRPGVATLARAMKARGYRTYYVGNWGLGDGEHLPTNHGFDGFYGLAEDRRTSTKLTVIDPGLLAEPPAPIWKQTEPGKVLAHESLIKHWTLAANAVRMTGMKGATFLVVGLTSPSYPQVPPENMRGVSQAGSYGDDIAAMDSLVSGVTQTIRAFPDRTGVASTGKSGKHTLLRETADIIAFTADGGRPDKFVIRLIDGMPGPPDSGPLRGTAGTLWEGGLRVPCIIRWPTHTSSGQVSNALVSVTDIPATLAAIAGAKLDTGTDGVDFTKVFKTAEHTGPRTSLVLWKGAKAIGVREGVWKLLDDGGTWRLFNLERDQRERDDVAAANAPVVERLKQILDREQAAIPAGSTPAPAPKPTAP